METKRYQQYKSLLRKYYIFTATYIKNGRQRGSGKLTLLLTNVHLNNKEILDHIWVINDQFAKKLASKQHRTITFKGKLIPIKKPHMLYGSKLDLGLKIESML